MTFNRKAAGPGWNRTAIHSALALAFANAVFVAPAAAVCVPATTTISTAVSQQERSCPGDTVTVTSAGAVTGAAVGGKGGVVAFEYTNGLSGALNNSGTISASPGAGVAYFATAVQINTGLSGSLTNNGTISVAPGAGGAVAYAYGVEVYGDLTGSLVNRGTISTTASDPVYSYAVGTSVQGQLSGTLNNSGTISANATGAVAYGNLATGVRVNGLDGTLTNSGTISAAVSAADSGKGSVEARGMAIFNMSGGALNNSGTISATATGGDARGVIIDNLDGVLNNSGTISATATGGTAESIYVGKGGTGTINNLAGGVLIGNINTAGTVAVNNAGTLSLPAGSGTSTISGNYTQQAGGLLALDARSSAKGGYGQLSVGGKADFSASNRIAIRPTRDNTLAVGDTLSGVVSAGTLIGTSFDIVGTPLLSFSGVKNGNAVDVTLTARNTFSGVLGGSPLGNTLDGLDRGYTGTRSIDPLIDALYSLGSRAELGNAAQNLSPVVADGMSQSTSNTLQQMGQIVDLRQQANRGGLSGGDLFYGDRQVWFKPFGSRAEQGNHSGVTGYDAKTYGMLFGADAEISEATRVGLAFGYARSDVESKNSDTAKQSGDVASYQLTGYGNYSLDAQTDLSFQAGYGYHRNDTKRVIRVGQMTPTVAEGDYHSWSTQLGVALSRNYALNPVATFTPSLRADYLYISSKGYTESGAGAMSLDVKDSSADAFILGADAKVSYALSETTKLSGNLGFGYDVINDRNSVTSTFVGGGAAFATKGLDQSPWLVRGGVGFVMAKGKTLEVSARYDFESRSSEFTNQTASLNLRASF